MTSSRDQIINNLTCEVCGDEPAVGVAAVPGIPYSAAYGRRCLDANAHPYWIIVANTAMIGGLDQSADWWQGMVNDTLTHLGKDRAAFTREVEQEIMHQQQAERDYEQRVLLRGQQAEVDDWPPPPLQGPS